MHLEGTRVDSGMAAILGLDRTALEPLCEEASDQARTALGAEAELHPGAGRVVVANDNAPGQLVISGARDALERAMELAKAAGAKRVVPLTVSGAFHSPVMAPASEGLARSVANAPIADAEIPIIANITARPVQSSVEVREELARQIASPVQWTRTVEYLAAEGVDTFVEIGSGQVLSGLVKRIAKGVTILSVGAATEVAPVAEQLATPLSE
jgi:[acyl-carrier-protein] S-malonyltransferase